MYTYTYAMVEYVYIYICLLADIDTDMKHKFLDLYSKMIFCTLLFYFTKLQQLIFGKYPIAVINSVLIVPTG